MRIMASLPTAVVALSVALVGVGVAHAQQQECGSPLICRPTSSPPTLDGDLRDWSEVQGVETKMFGALGRDEYPGGSAVYKCVYTSTDIYFAMEIPGRYRFSSSDNKRCASIATMFKVGEDAKFIGMGGCPSEASCTNGVSDDCYSYRVDIGAHWELRTTEQGKMYTINDDTGDGGNMDDEYGAGPHCRFDDNDYYAANEWSGAWSHSETTSTEEMSGRQMSSEHYRFELSRTLLTKSSATDRQLEAGETYQFGIAYWDPNESESGWLGHGHYVTGCGSDWIDLVLVEEEVDEEDEASEDGQDFEDIEDSQESEEIEDEQESEDVETLATGRTDRCDAPLICYPTPTDFEPTLDGDLGEWMDVPGLEAEMYSALGGQAYGGGNAVYKCLYTETHIVFAVEVPGRYRFSSSNNNHCASVATMFKIGEDASFYGMGGCPEARDGCDNGVPPICESYRVDIGAHWELKGTEQGELYRIDASTGTGNDIIANKDDEYGVSPYCRFDDDDEFAGNEWAGAWAHSSDQDGSSGYYRFELARLLATRSATTDRQLAPGGTYSFGIAYWDPNEDETNGWSGPGHFVTGCGSQWIDLVLVQSSGSTGSILTKSKLFTVVTMALCAFSLIL